jgi:hypothetical protein
VQPAGWLQSLGSAPGDTRCGKRPTSGPFGKLLRPFASAFTRWGFCCFVKWITALALDGDEHTITQSIVAIEGIADWKA